MKRMTSSLLLAALLLAPWLPAAVPTAVRQVVTAYYAAMEQEDLAAVRQLSAMPEDDPMYKVLVGIFLASDCQIRDLQVKDFIADADGKAGTALVSLKARVTDLAGGNAYDQERDLALVLAQDGGKWRVVKVWREMDYRMAVQLVRLDEESNTGGPPPITPETFEKLPPIKEPPGGGAGQDGNQPTGTAVGDEIARRILGTWQWRHRVVCVFTVDGTMYHMKNTSWRLVNAKERRFSITFMDGLQADVVMDEEGQAMTGKTSKGEEAWARRLTPAPQWQNKGPGPMVFSDSEFRKEAWSICATVSGGAGDRLTERREQPGRGGYRYVRHQLNGSGATTRHRMGVCHIYWSQAYDPLLNGPIHGIDYEETSALLSGHARGQRGGPMLAQGGVYYYYRPRNGAAVPFVNQRQWTSFSLTGLQAEDFVPADAFGHSGEPVSHPDFSEKGDQIMFGFFRGSMSEMTADKAATTETGTDDWKVTVRRDGTVTTPLPEPKPDDIPDGWKKIVHREHPHTYCIPRDWGNVHGDVKANVIQAYRSPRIGGAYVSVLHVPVAAPLTSRQLEGTIPLSLGMGGLFGRLIDKQPLKVGETPALLNRFAGTYMGFPTQTLQLVASQRNSLFYLAVVTAANNAKQEETARAIIGTFRFAQ